MFSEHVLSLFWENNNTQNISVGQRRERTVCNCKKLLKKRTVIPNTSWICSFCNRKQPIIKTTREWREWHYIIYIMYLIKNQYYLFIYLSSTPWWMLVFPWLTNIFSVEWLIVSLTVCWMDFLIWELLNPSLRATGINQ